MDALNCVGDSLVDAPFPTSQLSPIANQFDAAFLERKRRVWNQEIGVERVRIADSVAFVTHPLRTVEAEQLWTWRRKADSAFRTGIMGREDDIASLFG